MFPSHSPLVKQPTKRKLKKSENFTKVNSFLCTEWTHCTPTPLQRKLRASLCQAYSLFLNKIEMKEPRELLTDDNRELARYFKHLCLFFLHEFLNSTCKVSLTTTSII